MNGSPKADTTPPAPGTDFIRQIVIGDVKSGKHTSVCTRFPPEPNGYLHIGHAKSICLNFGIAREFGGVCHLRFDDTNPVKEDVEYVDSIQADVRWLGFDWADKMFYASDYFHRLHEYAVELIQKGKAYVCHLTAEETRAYRGTLTEAGRNSPYRDRSVEENLALFEQMRRGELEEGACVLRAKIDMASPNMNMRDPAVYRIKKAHHHRTGDEWCIYPMYDFAHGLSDAIEGITHSICTLEFEDHRPLYDWFLDQLDVPCHPQQIEFARLNLTYTVLSKRKLLLLVRDRHVDGWDDPRMPTIAGYRRRGYTPESIRNFCERIGVAKSNSTVEVAMLEYSIREDLNKRAPRVLGVLRPLKVVIDNYPDDQVEEFDAVNNPEDPSAGTRTLPFAQGALHRAGRLPRDAAAEVLPAVTGQGSAAALRVLRDLSAGGEGPADRRGDRGPLHVRPGDPRRRRARRAQGEEHVALGVGAARCRRRGAAVRSTVRGRVPGPRGGLPRGAEPGLARGAAGVQARAVAGGGAGRRPVPVRAAGLLLRRPEAVAAGRAGVQPHRRIEGHLGEDREARRLTHRRASATHRSRAAKVSQASMLPRSRPRRSQRARIADEPWVQLSGTV